MRAVILGLAALIALPGCGGCVGLHVVGCETDAQCAPLRCVNGACGEEAPVDGGGGACDPAAADNASRDSDCDGLSDAEEYSIVYPSGLRSAACMADTDGDGLLDGLEAGKSSSVVASCAFVGDAHPGSTTDPTAADSDGDGASDGAEDLNHNGKVDTGESNPRRKDSDCDGVSDGDELSGAKGCATDPTRRDSDGDSVPDGVETGAVAPGSDSACLYSPIDFDADPSTTTSACKEDSDGDGVSDGAEDTNQNGKVDPAELNPNLSADGQGPVAEVCATSKLRPLVFRQLDGPNLHLALPRGFDPGLGGQLTPITVAGAVQGLMGYSASDHVALLAYTVAAPAGAGSPAAVETALRAKIEPDGALSDVTTQTFTTWDGYPALQAFYSQAGTATAVARANVLANRWVGAGTGVLVGGAGVTGPFKLQAQYVFRSPQEVVVVVALSKLASYVEPTLFVVGDAAGGSALASFPDYSGVQCEPFAPSRPQVDFLFSVDDSGSMPQEQVALASAANAMATALNNSTLDWRIAMVTTSYLAAPLDGSNRSIVRGFTRDIGQFKAWLTEGSVCGGDGGCSLVSPAPPCDSNGPAALNGRNGGCWIGAGGTGNVSAEAILGSARKALNDLTPGTQTEQRDRVRDGARVVVVLMGDADDQTTGYTTSSGTDSAWEPVANFLKFFLATGTTQIDKNKLGVPIAVHGIICPDGVTCGEKVANPRRHVQVINATGGVMGSINDLPGIPGTIGTMMQSAIGASGHKLQRPPIGASIKVALDSVVAPGQCQNKDLPRSRNNGFDFDGLNQTLSFHGACRPAAGSSKAAVSYRYWVEGTGVCQCPSTHTCDPVTHQCVCLPDCGGKCAANTVCEPSNCSCEGGIN